ncbi:MAG: hypothetical protein U0Q03_15215 [Acidimicrobiales bacterium]
MTAITISTHAADIDTTGRRQARRTAATLLILHLAALALAVAFA